MFVIKVMTAWNDHAICTVASNNIFDRVFDITTKAHVQLIDIMIDLHHVFFLIWVILYTS